MSEVGGVSRAFCILCGTNITRCERIAKGKACPQPKIFPATNASYDALASSWSDARRHTLIYSNKKDCYDDIDNMKWWSFEDKWIDYCFNHNLFRQTYPIAFA